MENIKKMIGLIPANASEYARKTYKIGIFGVKNNFVLAGILLIGYCVIAPAVYISAVIERPVSTTALETLMCLYSIIAAYVGGLLIPAVMFAYVHKRRDRDFYHSMPIKRGQYFIGYLAAGFVMFAAPYLLMCIIMGLLFSNAGIAFSYILHSLALYIVIYASVTFSIMFSGSLLSSVVTMAFLNAFPAIVTYCSVIMSPIMDLNAYFTLLTPYIYIFTPVSGCYIMFDHFINRGLFGWVLWVQLAIAVVELVLAFIMYKYRRGETTMAVAFPKTRYILQYGVMFLVALFFTAVIGDVHFVSESKITNARIEAVVWTVIMTFVAFVVLNMILEKNFRAAFHKIYHLAIFAAAYAVVVAVIIGIVGSLPHWVVPIKTDAVLIHRQHYISTYDKPEDAPDSPPGDFYTDEEYAYSYSHNGYDVYVDKNGRSIYQIYLGREYWVVTDPEQVAELTKRLTDYMNDLEREYVSYQETEGEYYYVSMELFTLKPGEEITEGMYVDELRDVYSQYYNVFLNYMPDSEMGSLTSGMDMMEMHSMYTDYWW